MWAFDDDSSPYGVLAEQPAVLAIIPARNEAQTIAQTVSSLLQQDYTGDFSIVVVDDHSEDGTAAAAINAATSSGGESRATVVPARSLPAGWTGKLWALSEGVSRAGKSPAFYWFTDADIVHASDTLSRLMGSAQKQRLDLVSLMVLLRAETFAEKLLIPSFLFFFLKLYPPRWIADSHSRVAGAAGGCVLIRREALQRFGGLDAIRGEVIDDCALARAVKNTGGPIRLGVTRASVSLRSYQGFGEVRDMIARTAFTQLHYSGALLAGALVGMFFTYFVPTILLFVHHPQARILGAVACTLQALCYLPTVRFYRLSPLWALLLPLAAVFYCYSTVLSAVRYWLGRGGQWKGRAQAPRAV